MSQWLQGGRLMAPEFADVLSVKRVTYLVEEARIRSVCGVFSGDNREGGHSKLTHPAPCTALGWSYQGQGHGMLRP